MCSMVDFFFSSSADQGLLWNFYATSFGLANKSFSKWAVCTILHYRFTLKQHATVSPDALKLVLTCFQCSKTSTTSFPRIKGYQLASTSGDPKVTRILFFKYFFILKLYTLLKYFPGERERINFYSQRQGNSSSLGGALSPGLHCLARPCEPAGPAVAVPAGLSWAVQTPKRKGWGWG